MAETSNKILNLEETVLKPIDLLIQKRIESVKFDQTITCTIVDDNKAKDGTYMVSNGSSKFKAYTTETGYKTGEAVLVHIPQGDFSKQKTIIGKQVDVSDTPLAYVSPFETIVDMTNNLIHIPTALALNANFCRTQESQQVLIDWNENNPTDKIRSYLWEIDDKEFSLSKAYKGFPGHNNTEDQPIWDSGDIYYKDMTRIGIRADFKTFLHEFKTISGNYGLALEITFQYIDGDVTSSTPLTFKKFVELDSSSFFGDPYNYIAYFSNEDVFDIEEYTDFPIVRLRLFVYQRANFKTSDGEYVPYNDPQAIGYINPNILIQDIYVCLGTLVDEFKTDRISITNTSSNTYFKIDRYIQLNTWSEWNRIKEEVILSGDTTDERLANSMYVLDKNAELKYFENKSGSAYTAYPEEITNNLYKPLGNDIYGDIKEDKSIPWVKINRERYNQKDLYLNWIHKDPETGIAKLMVQDEVPADYEIRWYRHELGAKSPDPYAGPHWVRYCGVNEQYLNDKDGIKPSLKLEDISEDNPDTATNQIHINFIPDVNEQEEQIKAVVVFNEEQAQSAELFARLIARSEPLVLSNDDEVRSKATVIDENALAIKYNDEQLGNYFMYNRAGQLTNAEDSKVLRTLTAVFDLDTSLDVQTQRPDLILEECEHVDWYFPTRQTMIIPATSADIDDPNLMPVDTERESGDFYVQSGTISVGYFIKDTLNYNFNNNTILLKVRKDNQDYEAHVTMLFGTAGSSGSDYTIVIHWDEGRNVLNASDLKYQEGKTIESIISGRVALLDPEFQQTKLPENSSIDVSWHAVLEDIGSPDKPYKTYVVEDNPNILYPVDINGNKMPQVADYGNNNEDEEFLEAKRRSPWVSKTNENDYLYYHLNKKKFEKKILADDQKGLYASLPYRTLKPGDGYKYKFNFVEVDENNFHWAQQTYFIKRNMNFVIDFYEAEEETEVYYTTEPIKGYNSREGDFVELTREGDTLDRFQIAIKRDNSDNIPNLQGLMNSIYILKVTIKDFGDYDLVAYFPIPIKSGEKAMALAGENEGEYAEEQLQKVRAVQYINGATYVRYASSGEVDYNTTPYTISFASFATPGGTLDEQGKFFYNNNGNIPNEYQEVTQGHLYSNSNFVDTAIPAFFDNEKKPKIGKWQLLYKEIEDDGWINFGPDLKETATISTKDNEGNIISIAIKQAEDSNKIGYDPNYIAYEVPKLSPTSVYIEDLSIYGVQYKLGDEILWTQPILAYKDNYPSTTLNKWDGKSIQTDGDADGNGSGTIVANGLAAGKKESDNTFTGVVLGDWSRTDSDSFMTEQTGIYGFNHGQTSYCLLDDGTAFFGKDGKGRIYINGNKSQIYSAKWKAKSSLHEGMLLDIDDGYIKMNYTYKVQSENSEDEPEEPESPSEEESEINWGDWDRTNEDPDDPNELNDIFSILSSATSDSVFYVEDQIDNKPPLQSNGQHHITIASNANDWPLAIGTTPSESGREFRINWNGDGHFSGVINAYAGKIGGWNITENTLYSDNRNVILNSLAGSIAANKGKLGGWRLDSTKLTSDYTTSILLDPFQSEGSTTMVPSIILDGALGKITAVSGQIGGWYIDSTKLQDTYIQRDDESFDSNEMSSHPDKYGDPTTILKVGVKNEITTAAPEVSIQTNSIKIQGKVRTGPILEGESVEDESSGSTSLTDVSGYIGCLQGATASEKTALLGIRANGNGIALETSDTIRLSGIGSGNTCDAINLQANQIYLGLYNKSNTDVDAPQININNQEISVYIKSIIDADYIKGIIDADYIKGIIDATYIKGKIQNEYATKEYVDNYFS